MTPAQKRWLRGVLVLVVLLNAFVFVFEDWVIINIFVAVLATLVLWIIQ